MVSTLKLILSGMRRIIGWPPKSSDKTIIVKEEELEESFALAA
jgi:hypothetical protein